ncbi:MAG: hypothetical protein LRY41_02065 [Candidatus Pacebacteria bacterium]|nr:hypothetical protein [Candidatus Paceibacterota bacterium]MCD8528093.1 hypothetical protein [Candidatus Paceibacterota bacterium]MCD8563736.1 hypothetical protein [Candidatus Paceibacterota bacterium]
MSDIIPALMPRTYTQLEELVDAVAGYAPVVQFDIMDGHFVTGKTWPFGDMESEEFLAIVREQEDLPHADACAYELDLMVHEPGEYISQWQAMKPASIVLHLESMHDPVETLFLFQRLREHTAIGLSFSRDIRPQDIFAYLPSIDFIQCMGIAHIGKQGEPFDETVLEQIEAFHKQYPSLPISVDGAVSRETLPRLIAAGARRLVVGSGIFAHPEPVHAFMELRDQATAFSLGGN